MAKYLVIVESPAKSKTITKYLGKDYQVLASFGHVRDLPPYTMGVDIENDFEPEYKTIKGKGTILKEIQRVAKAVDGVLLATDPDREGEAIAWHVQVGAKIPEEKVSRIVFNEITKSAIQEAIKHPRSLNTDLIDAQQARRVLDRLIGYKLSPVLSRKIRKGLSAGRVQSVTVKLICDREREILAFVPEEYWVIEGEFQKRNEQSQRFLARIAAKGSTDQKLAIGNKKEADQVLAGLKGKDFTVHEVNKKEVKRNPFPPFITSTLQQDASRKLGWTSKRTMIIAQQLYEGIEVNGEASGLITYMRTDSFRLSNDAVNDARDWVRKRFGDQYLPEKPRVYKGKKNIQDAHEAIRPTTMSYPPDTLQNQLSKEQYSLYKLIWNRFVACQMLPARFEQTQVWIKGGDYFFKATGQVLLFDGFTTLYVESTDDSQDPDAESRLPKLARDDALQLNKTMDAEQKFTQPPHRFTEASLVKVLEEKGIGRPSTYAPTISTILDRLYVEREKKQLRPTELGMLVDEKLGTYFKHIVDVNFTAEMETHLDEITEKKHVWYEIIQDFYAPFLKDVEFAMEKMEKINTDKPTDEICEKCQSPMVIRSGRFGEFMACSNFPECKNTKAIIHEMGVDCPDCGKALVERRSKRGKLFFACSGYPDCKYASWDRPIPEPCPDCKAPRLFIKEKRKEGTKLKYCGKCDYESKTDD